MARGRAVRIVLNGEERRELETRVRRRRVWHGAATRARIVLLAADGMNNCAIAAKLDVSRLTVGTWRGRPVFILRRTAEEIARAKADDAADLIDPEPDGARVQKDEWLVVVGICTHLGCIPQGQKPLDPRGTHGGWFCTCHGSVYDISGRVRRGPAPRNLVVPPYAFLDETMVRIG